MIEIAGFIGYSTPGFVASEVHRPHRPAQPSIADSPGPRRVQESAARGSDDADSSFHAAKINAIQQEIRTGTYETSERISTTVSILLDIVA